LKKKKILNLFFLPLIFSPSSTCPSARRRRLGDGGFRHYFFSCLFFPFLSRFLFRLVESREKKKESSWSCTFLQKIILFFCERQEAKATSKEKQKNSPLPGARSAQGS
jgi:hypothetical protein